MFFHRNIDAATYPGIGGGVVECVFAEFGLSPVGELCSFRDPASEKECGKPPEAVMVKSLVPGAVPKVDKTVWLKMVQVS